MLSKSRTLAAVRLLRFLPPQTSPHSWANKQFSEHIDGSSSIRPSPMVPVLFVPCRQFGHPIGISVATSLRLNLTFLRLASPRHKRHTLNRRIGHICSKFLQNTVGGGCCKLRHPRSLMRGFRRFQWHQGSDLCIMLMHSSQCLLSPGQGAGKLVQKLCSAGSIQLVVFGWPLDELIARENCDIGGTRRRD